MSALPLKSRHPAEGVACPLCANNGPRTLQRNQRWAALATFASRTPRQPNNKIAPAANGISGIRVEKNPVSAITARIAKASEPSSTNSPANSRKTETTAFMAKPPPLSDVQTRQQRAPRLGKVQQMRLSQDPRPARRHRDPLRSKTRRTRTTLRQQ